MRVAFDDSVRLNSSILPNALELKDCFSALDRIIIVVMIVATIVIGMIAMTDTVVIALGRPLVVENTMIAVLPGLRLPRGRLMIKGLQGTMIIGAEAMMTAKRLIIMIDVGMIKTAAETTEGAKKKKIVSMTDQDTQMAKDGLVEEYIA